MQARLPRIRLRSRPAKIAIGVVAAVALLMGMAAWQVPRLVRDALTGQVAEMIGRDIAVGEISFNPFTLTLRAHDLAVDQPEADPLLRVERLEVSAAWSSLVRLAPVVDRLHVHRPQLALVRDGPVHFNFSDIVERVAKLAAEKPAPEEPEEEGLPRFSLNNLVLDEGAVALDDQVTGRQHVIDQIGLGIPFISNFGYATDIDVEPRLHARVNGSTFALDGTARPFDDVPRSTLNLAFLQLELDKLADAWPGALPLAVQRALLDANLQLAFEQPRDGPARLRVTGDMALRELDLRDRQGAALLQWDALTVRGVDAEPLASRLHVAGIDLRAPHVHAARDAQGRINWLQALQQAAAAPAGPAESGNRAGDPRTGAQPVDDGADAADTAATADTVHAADAADAGKTDGGGQVAGAARPATPPGWDLRIGWLHVTGGRLQWQDAALPLEYALGGLTLQAGPIALPQPAGEPVALSLAADADAGGKLSAQGKLAISPLSLDLDVRADAVALKPFDAALRKASPLQLDSGSAGIAAKLLAVQRGDAMEVSVRDIDAALTDTALQDNSVKPAVKLRASKLALTADRYDLAGGDTAFALQADGLQGKGALTVKGRYTQQPMSVQADVDLQGLDAASFAPYVASSLNATVRAMTVGAKGKVAFSPAAQKSPMRLDWSGAVDVSGLDLQDRVNRAEFMKWRNLSLAGMKIAINGERISAHLGKVVLDDFFGRVILNAQGRLNVMDLVAEPGTAGGSITQDTQTRAAPSKPAAGPAPEISVDSVALRRGRVVFTDRFVKPNYTADLSAIDGSVSAVSSTNPRPANVRVAGRVYGTAPFSISGTVQPFARYLSLDLKASAQGVDLPRFTTYSAKYMGYPITRGKLSLDVQYRIEDRQLTARNRVVLNQLTLGDRTDSPDAINLPVTLAIALLKDARGNIDINLPISGSLDDPQFSIGGIILRVFVNLITKAVTAPFSLLASAFGSDEELSYVGFEPGSAELDDKAREQVTTLASALNDRPSLRLDIVGRVDPQADEQGLRRTWLEHRLREAKARDQSTRSRKVDPAGVTVSDAERAKYLEDVYDDTDIEDKPRNFIGMAKSVPPDQMEAMLLAAAPVDEEALRKLADARAQAVYELLQESGPADRIFVVAPKLDAGGIDDGGPASRVDFALK